MSAAAKSSTISRAETQKAFSLLLIYIITGVEGARHTNVGPFASFLFFLFIFYFLRDIQSETPRNETILRVHSITFWDLLLVPLQGAVLCAALVLLFYLQKRESIVCLRV